MSLLYLFFYKKTDRKDLILGTAVAGPEAVVVGKGVTRRVKSALGKVVAAARPRVVTRYERPAVAVVTVQDSARLPIVGPRYSVTVVGTRRVGRVVARKVAKVAGRTVPVVRVNTRVGTAAVTRVAVVYINTVGRVDMKAVKTC